MQFTQSTNPMCMDMKIHDSGIIMTLFKAKRDNFYTKNHIGNL